MSDATTRANVGQPKQGATLAVAICTCDNIRTIKSTLDSVQQIADRILVVDSGSSDGTIETAQSFYAQVIHQQWPGLVKQRQFAIDQCRDSDWVLVLDSDEALDDALQQSVARVVRENDPAHVGWEFNRKVRMFGRVLHHIYQPEWRLRLARSGAGRVVGLGPDGLGGHDRVEVNGPVGRLTGTCIHDSWADLPSMLRQYIQYGQRAATYSPSGGRAIDILTRPSIAFIKQYVFKRGWCDGRAGFFAAASIAAGTLIKHLFMADRRWNISTAPSAPVDPADPAPPIDQPAEDRSPAGRSP